MLHRSVFTKLLALMGVLIIIASCGKEETAFEDIDGEVGNVPGAFDVRLGASYRDQVDSLSDKINALSTGMTSKVTSRFKSDDAVDDKGTKLSDLLKIELPSIDNDLVNQNLFNKLNGLKGDEGNYFDVINTEKYLSGPFRYAQMNLLGPDADAADQYYLEMIRHPEVIGAEGFADLVKVAAPIVVAVLDTGVLANHEDLQNVMWSYKDIVGYDATVTPGKTLKMADAIDVNGHGTHVAGIIGAEGNNDSGIRGVGYVPGFEGDAKKSTTEIMAVKVLNDKGAGTSEMINTGVKWAVDQHRAQKVEAGREKQKLILNMSLGGPFDVEGYEIPDADKDGNPDLVDDIFTYATQNDDVLILVAAGNESCGIGGACEIFGKDYAKTYYYPCSYENVLCVAATTHEDELAGFTNRLASVGISAPGYQIISSVPTSESDYGYYSGTSQATPVTAGAAAMIWGMYPDFTANEMKAILQNSAANLSTVTSAITSKHGRLDLAAAMAYAKTLKDSGSSPIETAPADGVVKSDKNTASNAPAQGAIDPNAVSGNQQANQKETTSSSQCGVLGKNSRTTGWLWLLLLCLPVFVGITHQPVKMAMATRVRK